MAVNLIPSLSGYYVNGGVGQGVLNNSQIALRLVDEIATVPVKPSTTYTVRAFVGEWDDGVVAGVHQLGQDLGFLNDSGWRVLHGDGYRFITRDDAAYVRLVFRSSTYTAERRDQLHVALGNDVLLRMSEGEFSSWEPSSLDCWPGGGRLDE